MEIPPAMKFKTAGYLLRYGGPTPFPLRRGPADRHVPVDGRAPAHRGHGQKSH